MSPPLQGFIRLKTLALLLLIPLCLVHIEIVEPRISVRWADGVGDPDRRALEGRFGLVSAQHIEDSTWRYVLRDSSRENLRALVGHASVADTHDIDRAALRAPDREIRVRVRGWDALIRASRTGPLQPQSLVLVLCGGLLLWSARLAAPLRRRAAVALLLAAAVMAFALPLRQPITMGDSKTYTGSRASFEDYAGVRQIRSEAHLSYVLLGWLDGWYGRSVDSPARALRALTRAATALFFLAAFGVGTLERWTPAAVRYLGLALMAPAALLYFGYQELGYLCLNIATFPVLVRGLRTGSRALEGAGILSGVGAALHGFGLLSLAGAGVAALGRRVPPAERVRGALRVGIAGLLGYLMWLPLYAFVVQLPMAAGHADSIPLRPWTEDIFTDGRVNAAILSAAGARDLLFSAWVTGFPMIGLAASLWRRYADEARAALLYAAPSAVFLVVFWPVQGLGVDTDLVLAAFPGAYALAWTSAHDARRATIAAALLASAHLAFWWMVFGDEFVNVRIR